MFLSGQKFKGDKIVMLNKYLIFFTDKSSNVGFESE